MDTELRSQLQDIVNNPELLEKLTTEQVVELYNKANPLNYAVEDGKTFSCISMVNLRGRHLAWIKMMSLIGYVYRALYEYDDFCHVDECDRDDDYKKASKIKQAIIKDFLDRLFEYNPETHVKSAYLPNPDDPERPAINLNSQGNPAAMKVSGKWPLINHHAISSGKVKDFENTFNPVPSYDIYFKWQYYEEVNYDKIKETVTQLYGEKIDLEQACQIHRAGFTTLDQAEKYAEEYGHLTTAPILSIKDGDWALTGPDKKNRERMKFWNSENQVLKKIFDQVATDQKFGKELMKKKITRVKKADIRKHGKDPPELKNYIKNKNLEVKPALNEQEQKELEDYADAIAATKGAPIADTIAATKGAPIVDAGEQTVVNDLSNKEINNTFDNNGRLLRKDNVSELTNEVSNLSINKENTADDTNNDNDNDNEDTTVDPRDIYENVDEDGVPKDAIVVDFFTNDGTKLTKGSFFTKSYKPGEVDDDMDPSMKDNNRVIARVTEGGVVRAITKGQVNPEKGNVTGIVHDD